MHGWESVLGGVGGKYKASRVGGREGLGGGGAGRGWVVGGWVGGSFPKKSGWMVGWVVSNMFDFCDFEIYATYLLEWLRTF